VDRGGFSNAGEYVENWTDWYGFLEFWRMYRSTQFLSYIALREDTLPQEYGNAVVPILDVISAIYSITEFVEFAHRLYRHGFYKSGVELSISIRNAQNRHLFAGRGNMPFIDSRISGTDVIDVTKEVNASALKSDHRRLAVEFCLDLFDYFGWNPNPTQIEADQEDFYKHRIRT
jgi:hypothetical protein